MTFWLNIYDPETNRLPDASWTREEADAKAGANRVACLEFLYDPRPKD